MKFVDSCHVDVVAGRGGNGVVAFRREKFVPFGGPAGGDGGRGADIVFVADEGLSTLLDLTYGRALRGEHGGHGQGADCYGRAAKELAVRVPVGTQVYDRDTGELLFDIDKPGLRVVVAKGGKGGRGNIHFATPFDRAPRRAEPGEPGQERRLRLELKVMADVGLLGFPNVGKSTFIRAVSRAQPKVADYPFTTLTPHLGVVRVGDEATFVVADIPGLIPGAAEGAGLGHRFLKHVERCRALLHLITLDPSEGRDPWSDYEALQRELARFDPELAKRPQIVAMSKADVTEVRQAYARLKSQFAKKKIDLRLISAATGEGIKELASDLYRLVMGRPAEDWELPAEPAVALAETVTKAGAKPPAKRPARAKKSSTARTTATRSTKKASDAKKRAARPAKKSASKKKSSAATSTKKSASSKRRVSPRPTTKKAASTKRAGKTSARGGVPAPKKGAGPSARARRPALKKRASAAPKKTKKTKKTEKTKVARKARKAR